MTTAPHLDMVAVHFSTRCGAKCSFCYFGNPISQKDDPTDWQTIQKVLDEVAREDVKEVLFVGGDPVIHPHFRDSLDYAKHLGLRTSVLSNSWAIRPITAFADTVALIDNCEATVLGPSAPLHDSIVGVPGAYTTLVSNLTQLSALGKPIGVCLNAMPQNLEHLFDTVSSLHKTHRLVLRSVMFQRIVPSGGSRDDTRFGLSLRDMRTLMEQVDQIAKEFGLPITFEDPVPHCTVEPQYRHYLTRCEWGYTRGSINHRGELNRCGADDSYRLGNIFEQPLQKTWREHPTLVSFRSKHYLPDECLSCDLLEACGGGCPLSCGTHVDHDLDILYVERTQPERQRLSVSMDSIPLTFSRVRRATWHDWPAVCRLERALFPADVELFTVAALKRITERFPDALWVAEHEGALVGYAALAPLTEGGMRAFVAGPGRSICTLPEDDLAESIEDGAALFVEVIAFSRDCPPALKRRLWRWLLRHIRHDARPILTTPVSTAGEQLAVRHGFVAVAGAASGATLFARNLRN